MSLEPYADEAEFAEELRLTTSHLLTLRAQAYTARPGLPEDDLSRRAQAQEKYIDELVRLDNVILTPAQRLLERVS